MRTPNLVVFLSDNHARNFLGAAGHPMVKTPAIDGIAAGGVRFANAYCASPLCCPSRAALATGRFPHQTGYWDNALAYDGRVPTWHHRVREAGRTMTAIGKLHYRSEDDDNGFDEEIIPLHIVDGKGALNSLLRATPEGVPSRSSHKSIYAESVPGKADYQDYDRDITGEAIAWLDRHAGQETPWALLVSYASPHPPFKVPQRFWDMYPLADAPLPQSWPKAERPQHPSDDYLAWMNQLEAGFDEEFVRRVVAGYCGLITHTDEQIGQVLDKLEALGVRDETRLIYTSDHGEAAGAHGILGKANFYEHSLGVPLAISGPGVPRGKVVDQPVSHVDLFPTIVEAMDASLTDADADLPGRSLWPLIRGESDAKPVFAEYHATGAKTSGFALRDGRYKLVCYAGMPDRLFDLEADPDELVDLLAGGQDHPAAAGLKRKLLQIVDPDAIDARSKAEQAAHMERHGGAEAVLKAGFFARSPIPGKVVSLEDVESAKN